MTVVSESDCEFLFRVHLLDVLTDEFRTLNVEQSCKRESKYKREKTEKLVQELDFFGFLTRFGWFLKLLGNEGLEHGSLGEPVEEQL
jgi:hypothetical protein